jgi:heat shock protein HslJ
MKLVIMATLAVGMLAIFLPRMAGPGNAVQRPLQVNKDSLALAGEWYLQPVLPSDTATGKLPMLNFSLGQKKFTGFTGCNKMNGMFNLQGDLLVISKDLVLTKMTCEGFNEKEFIMNLARVNRFRIRDSVLSLMIDQSPVSKWIRKPGVKPEL